MTDYDCITQTIHARSYTSAGAWRSPNLIVIHSTEGSWAPGAAAGVANWFAGPSAPQASAHVIAGCDAIVRAVSDEEIAWAAPGANQNGLQLEITGRAAWTSEQWLEHRDILTNAAKIVAAWVTRWEIPLRKIDSHEVSLGTSGICGHVDVSEAFKRSSHWDPGHGFPWAEFLAMIELELLSPSTLRA